MKQGKKVLVLLMCLLLLTGCVSNVTPITATVTLPPPQRGTAPLTDSTQAVRGMYPMYFPGRDGTLLAQLMQVDLSTADSEEEAVVRTFLTYASNPAFSYLTSGVGLGLNGANSVEVAGTVCTVNLSSSALQLDYQQRYTLFLSLAATLSQLGNIRFVNVLVADQAVGLDISGNLPAGSITAHPGETLTSLWEQMDARRTPLGADASQHAFSCAVSLYFPTIDNRGVLPETRNLTFAGQTPAQYAAGLLIALSQGAQYTKSAAIQMPNLPALLVSTPALSELADGNRLLTLRFSDGLLPSIEACGISPMVFTASLVTTMTTFIPSISAVRIYSGEALLTVKPSGANEEAGAVDGFLRRRQYLSLLREEATIYLSQGERLVSVQRTLPAGSGKDPRQLLGLVIAGATEAEMAAGITSPLPMGMDNTDILAYEVEQDALLLNLSPRFERLIRQRGSSGEQLLCYSMVATLCKPLGLHRVQFFWNGETIETLGGNLYWGGDFLLNEGLIDQTTR